MTYWIRIPATPAQLLNRTPIRLKIPPEVPILLIEARMNKGANEMKEPDFEVQEIEIGEPVESNEQGFGAVISEYIY
jgi:hypothetical protein